MLCLALPLHTLRANQLLRKASMGLISEARRAGKYPLSSARVTIEIAMAAKAIESHGEVSKSNEAIRRVVAKDPIVPNTMPTRASRNVFASTSLRTRRAL